MRSRLPRDGGHVRLALPLAMLVLPAGVHAATVAVPLKDAKVIVLQDQAAQISVADAEVVDVKLLSPSKMLMTGKAIGQSGVTVVYRSNAIARYLVQVHVPTTELAARIERVLPRQKIRVEALGNTVALHGQVEDPLLAERAERVARAHLASVGIESAKVLNFLAVSGRQQVQLRVKIAEVSRNALRQIGLNAFWRQNQRTAGLLSPGTDLNNTLAPDLEAVGNRLQPGGTGATPVGDAPLLPLIRAPFTTDAFGLLFAQGGGAFPLTLALSLLQGKGLAKVLSEPSLVAYSGKPANFLAGGEFPIPIPQGLGQTAIEFKKFGVQLGFTPTVLADRQIRLEVSVAVSEQNQSGSVLIAGTQVPALSTRHSETTVQLKSGESFAIAGLLQDRMENSSSKLPLLGDIPVIGLLFRRNSFRRIEQELVVMVTAELVRPLKRGEIPPLPGEDELSDPGSLRFFLLGTVDAEVPARRRSPAGPIGFSR